MIFIFLYKRFHEISLLNLKKHLPPIKPPFSGLQNRRRYRKMAAQNMTKDYFRGPKCIKELTEGERDKALETSTALLVNLRLLLYLPWVNSVVHAIQNYTITRSG